MTQTELARVALSSKSAISAYELGNQAPKRDVIWRMDAGLDADGALVELWGLLELGAQDSATVADVEHNALAMTAWEMRVVPGLLQTPQYAAEAMRTSVPPDRLDRELSIRLTRQKILDTIAAAWFVLDESLLPRLSRGYDL